MNADVMGTPVQMAVSTDWYEMVDYLVAAGSDLSGTVYRAVLDKDPWMLRYLLDLGAPLDPESDGHYAGETMIDLAEELGFAAGVEILREYGEK